MLEKISKNNKDKTNNTNDSNNWELMVAKQQQKEMRATYDKVSYKYLPLNLPPFESEVYEESKTSMSIPITINIKSKKGSNHPMKNTRLLVALIKAFQMAYQDTYIGSINDDNKIPKINHHNQVPVKDIDLMKYMMEPIIGPNKSYYTKIIIHTNHELKDYINNTRFRSYISNELISIEYNTLNVVIPQNVGFFEQTTTNRQTTLLHHLRLQKLLPKNAPEYQVNLQKIYSSTRQFTYVVMIQIAKEDIEKLVDLLRGNDKNENIFFPWQMYTTLSIEKRKQCLMSHRIGITISKVW